MNEYDHLIMSSLYALFAKELVKFKTIVVFSLSSFKLLFSSNPPFHSVISFTLINSAKVLSPILSKEERKFIH